MLDSRSRSALRCSGSAVEQASRGSRVVVVFDIVKQLVANDPWNVVQNGFDPAQNRIFESLFSLGNGHFGGRGNHEERYSGDSLHGNYLAGIYYPDPTRVGWWKNGYPDYFAKVLNAPDWKALDISIDGEVLDLATADVVDYRRVLHMKTGELERHVRATLPNGRTIAIDTVRFVSMTRQHVGAIRYRITPLDGGARMTIESKVDGDVVNEDSNYDEGFWEAVDEGDRESNDDRHANEEDRLPRGDRRRSGDRRRGRHRHRSPTTYGRRPHVTALRRPRSSSTSRATRPSRS